MSRDFGAVGGGGGAAEGTCFVGIAFVERELSGGWLPCFPALSRVTCNRDTQDESRKCLRCVFRHELRSFSARVCVQAGAVLFLLVAGCMAGSLSRPSFTRLDAEPLIVQKSAVGLDLCPTCINFAGQFINQLLNIILSE